MKRFFLIPLLSLALVSPVIASVPGPLCEADVTIVEKDATSITGTLTNASCPEYEGVNVRIFNALGDFSYNDITAIRVGAESFSSMGPNGPVEGTQWKTISAKTGGLSIPTGSLPIISVETLSK